jgi:2-polyprenyl-3-methyl-5-hydroxy-6-metoxy-1,4-benzoquinol methylase
MAARYARSPIADEAAYARKLATTQRHLRPHMAVLELGCGTGGTALAHAPFVHSVRATDLSEAMIAIARERATAAGVGNVTFEVASAETVDAAPGSVDVVLALSVLHLVQDPPALLRRAAALLPPGGLLVASTPCLAEVAPWLRFLAPLGARLGVLPALRFFARTELEDWFREAGFEVEEAWQPSVRSSVFHVARRVGS